MTARRTLTPAGQKRIAIDRNWRALGGGMLCLENRKVVLLGTGKKPEWDHAHPLAIGGSNRDDNFQPMSREDHKRKSRGDGLARRMIRRATGANKERPKRRWPKGRKLGSKDWLCKVSSEVVRRV